jgi:hypothetical protein
MNMEQFIAPKSSQLNADDLVGGPRAIRINRVSGTGNADQPVAIHFDGDDNRPYLPCKSMRRVLVSAWGPDASQYVGRSMTLFRDPKVAFGGMEVGGIRISHMSHIERDMTMALTVTKAKRAPFVVLKLADAVDKAAVGAASLVQRIQAAPDMAALEAITADDGVTKQRAWMAKHRPELAGQVNDAVAAALGRCEREPGEEG